MRGLLSLGLWGMSVVVLILGASDSFAQEKTVDSYLRLFPAHTNSLMVMHVEELKKTQKAEAEGWNQNDSSLWLAGTEPLPGWVTFIVRGAHSHLQHSNRDWAMSITPLPESLPFSAIARTSGQNSQTIYDRPVFLSAKGAYVTALTKDLIGVLQPADRADLARWIKQAESATEPVIPKYLQKVANTPGHVMIAFDLNESLDLWTLREWLKTTETLKGMNTMVQPMSDLLESVEGMTLAITVTDKIAAELTIDFKNNLSPIAEKFHPLLIEYLTQSGAMLEDVEQAQVKLGEKSIVLTMDPLSDSGFQRIMSLILSPTSGHAAEQVAANNTPPKEGEDKYDYYKEPTVEATQQYYGAIEEMLGDLEKRTGPNYLATAVWHERYAQKIDHLPITSVDPEMMKYGRETSARLVALAASLRGTPLEINSLNNAVTYKISPEYSQGWWGGGAWTSSGQIPAGYQIDSNVAQIREQMAQAVMAGSKERDQLWQIQIDERNAVRQEMYQKYKVDFGAGPQEKEKKKR